MKKKTCFFICPIGPDNSDIRSRSDALQRIVLEQVLSEEFEIVRADQMDEPGSVTQQVIRLLIEADLVIADLTDRNPNVFYELGVRHAVNKQTIIISSKSDGALPFDIAAERAIFYDIKDITSVEKLKERLKAAAEYTGKYNSPIAIADASFSRENSAIVDMFEEIKDKIDYLEFGGVEVDDSNFITAASNYLGNIEKDMWDLKQEVISIGDKLSKKLK